jgi:hypothetical protein
MVITGVLSMDDKKTHPLPESPSPCSQMTLAVCFPVAGIRIALIPADMVALYVWNDNWKRFLYASRTVLGEDEFRMKKQ